MGLDNAGGGATTTTPTAGQILVPPGYNYTPTLAPSTAPTVTEGTVQAIIVKVARELGVDPQLALAIAYQESGFNARAIGDGGTSYGLFQLHQGGELGSYTGEQVMSDPELNARIALSVVAQVAQAHPDWSPGQIAAAAQRPANQGVYSQSINAAMGRTDLGSMNVSGTTTVSAYGGGAPNIDPGLAAAMAANPALKSYIQAQSVLAKYPDWAWAIQDPELGPLLLNAANTGLSDAQVLAQVEQTQWWQTHSDSQRQWQALQSTNPAQAQQLINSKIADLQQQAAIDGFPLDPAVAHSLAQQSLSLGWNSTQERTALVAAFHVGQGNKPLSGHAAADASQLQALAGEYGVPLSPDTINQWVGNMLNGTADTASFQAYLQQQAMGRFPSIAQQIQAGITPKQYFDPYIQDMARLLEVAPSSITMDDPRLRPVINSVDQKTGARIPMSLSQAEDYFRGLPEYRQTKGAMNDASTLAQFIGNTFGASTGGSMAGLGAAA